ncbi:hypothetical protein CYMTET_32862 [Cymbomonas tetramitiformis]|uniref:Uncharacterized protein n=1 Tax=Cymbomonas tetramitiformis TaxID=36881 RepID=A0AAE0KRI3_9CHLO|nr:hypothetical protein CYMTET_32862 [Cymbomonas tetramitiformis]
MGGCSSQLETPVTDILTTKKVSPWGTLEGRFASPGHLLPSGAHMTLEGSREDLVHFGGLDTVIRFVEGGQLRTCVKKNYLEKGSTFSIYGGNPQGYCNGFSKPVAWTSEPNYEEGNWTLPTTCSWRIYASEPAVTEQLPVSEKEGKKGYLWGTIKRLDEKSGGCFFNYHFHLVAPDGVSCEAQSRYVVPFSDTPGAVPGAGRVKLTDGEDVIAMGPGEDAEFLATPVKNNVYVADGVDTVFILLLYFVHFGECERRRYFEQGDPQVSDF